MAVNRPITQTASAVSAAHIYGKKVISAESFTSNPTINWKGNPAMAKTSGDLAWTYGINEFMFHRFAHQANIYAEPGMTMNRWGFHFDRTQTWWKNAGVDWFKYIARGSYLLRQGHPVSDLLVYIGEGSPNGSYHRSELISKLPKTINFDNVNTDVLVNRLNIKGQELTLPEGTSYKILLLKNSKVISLATLKRIHQIAINGIPIYGDVPKILAGYYNTQKDKKEFSELQKQVASLIQPVEDWNAILSNHNILPDLKVHNDEAIDYAHRRTDNEDIYFFYNQDTTGLKSFDISFNVKNKIPELWNPMTGKIIKKADFVCHGKVTRTTIKLEKGASIFVVFRENATDAESVKKSNPNINYSFSKAGQIKASISKNGKYEIPLSSGKTWKIDVTDIPKPFKIDGSWKVNFNKKNGYGNTVIFNELIDWTVHPNDSIKYYSGTSTYQKTITIPDELVADDIIAILDLGNVNIVAEVIINNKNIGISWMPPHHLSLGKYLKGGQNKLEIRLTNQWSNRLIGDERYPPNDGNYKLGPHRATKLKMPDWYVNNEPRPAGKRTTFTTAPFYKKDSPLMPSGLIGPVEIKFIKEIKNNKD